MLKIKNAEPFDNYLLKVQFENNEELICDITEFLDRGSFIELKNKNLFKSFKVTGFSVEWPNHVDLSSDTLYAIGKKSA